MNSTPSPRRTRRGWLAALGSLAAATLLVSCTPATADSPTTSAPATIAAQDGIVVGDGAVEVAMWSDSSCPFCQQVHAAIGEELDARIEAGDITFTLHPMTYVSAKHGDTSDYSTRAAALLFAVAEAGEAERVPALSGLLLEHQPTEAGAAPSDDDLRGYARDAGVEADVDDFAAYAAAATASNDYWREHDLPGTTEKLQGVPTILVDGETFEIAFDGSDLERFRAAIDGD